MQVPPTAASTSHQPRDVAAVVYNDASEMHFGIPPSVLAPVCLIGGVLAVAWAVLAYRSQRRFLRRAL